MFVIKLEQVLLKNVFLAYRNVFLYAVSVAPKHGSLLEMVL